MEIFWQKKNVQLPNMSQYLNLNFWNGCKSVVHTALSKFCFFFHGLSSIEFGWVFPKNRRGGRNLFGTNTNWPKVYEKPVCFLLYLHILWQIIWLPKFQKIEASQIFRISCILCTWVFRTDMQIITELTFFDDLTK